MIYKTGMDNGGLRDEEFINQACERYAGCGMRNSEIRVCESYEGCYRNHDAVVFENAPTKLGAAIELFGASLALLGATFELLGATLELLGDALELRGWEDRK